jgi:hypothetical protein
MRHAQYASVMLTRSIAACAATALLGLGMHATARAQGAAVPAALQSIRVMPSVDGGPSTVILEANGPLPDPAGDSLAGPPRVFVDLPGVVAAPTLTRTGRDPLILRARVARYSDVPLVTRVVLDLSRVSRFRVDASARAAGRLVLMLEGSATAAPSPAASVQPAARAKPAATGAPPARPAPRTTPSPTGVPAPAPVQRTSRAAPLAPPASSPRAGEPRPEPGRGARPEPGRGARPEPGRGARPEPGRGTPPDPEKPAGTLRTARLRPNAAREPSAAQVEAYTAQIAALVSRLQGLRPLLLAIDRREEITTDLNAAAAEFDAIGRILTAIKPIPSRAGTHGMLLQACVLGSRATRTLQDATRSRDAAEEWNAASAAAGALILLDRAIGDIG